MSSSLNMVLQHLGIQPPRKLTPCRESNNIPSPVTGEG
jgi:hypothetical protein